MNLPNDPITGPIDAPKRGPSGLAARAVAVCSWLSLAVVVAMWVLLLAGDLWGPATVVMFGPRWLVALPPALLILPAVSLRRRSLGPLLLAVILTLGPVMGFCVPWSRLRMDAPQGQRLRLLTCNMHDAKVDPAALDPLFVETWPDVIAIQLWRDSARSEVLERREWHVHRTPGMFLASRHPIQRAEQLGTDSVGEDGSVMRYELATPAGVVTVFSLHFATPRDGLADLAHRDMGGLSALEAGSKLRFEQSERLARKASNVAGPVVLMGDFNTPPESAIFRRVWTPFTDAFSAAGWGWGYTFSSRHFAVRIDHILMGQGVRGERCWVADDVGSPHRPVLADVVVVGGG